MLNIFCKKKLLVFLSGGLGNQLFIYTAATNFAHANKINDIEYIQNNGFISNVKSINDYIKKIKIKKNNKYSFPWAFTNIFKNKLFYSMINDKSILKKRLSKQFIMQGYFQNNRWYSNFFIKTSSEIYTADLIKKLKKVKTHDIVISLRRTDYLKLGMALKTSYYLKSLKKLKVTNKEKIKIISDDLNYAKKFAQLLKKLGYEIDNDRKYYNSKSLNDFLILIKSKKLIMSNSSFCWWAAIVRDNLKFLTKNVACPRYWYPSNKNILKSIPSNHPGNPLRWQLVSADFIL